MSKLKQAFIAYLQENYSNVSDEHAENIATGMEHYFQETYMPDVAALYELKQD